MRMANRTFVLIKPDGVQQKVVGEIMPSLAAVEKVLSVSQAVATLADSMKTVLPSKQLVAEHYEEHKGKSFFDKIVDYVSSGQTVAMVLEGENGCFKTVREMIGATRPEDSAKGTIRGDFGTKAPYNVIHGSDSVESAQREAALWFSN